MKCSSWTVLIYYIQLFASYEIFHNFAPVVCCSIMPYCSSSIAINSHYELHTFGEFYYVCMYVYMYVCLHVCMCVYVCIYVCMYVSMYVYMYTGCPRRKGPNFRRVFLRSNYTDITQNTYIQSSMVTEILAREEWMSFVSAYCTLSVTSY